MAQTVKCLPALRETRVRSLGREDPLEKEMAIHSSILAWKIPWTEEPGRLQSMGSQSQTRLSNFTFTFPGSSDGKESACQLGRPGFKTWVQPLGQEAALAKGMATHSSILAWRILWTWRATDHGVAKSQTGLRD